MKIYTKSGDDGETGLFGGRRVPKNDLRVRAYGDVDELNSFLGLADTRVEDPRVSDLFGELQSDLFTIGADLATPEERSKPTLRLDPAKIARLEEQIDDFDGDLPELKSFILPGGTEAAATLQVCRAVCRRAERSVVDLAHAEEINPAVLVYLNRLSDLLFVLARRLNHEAGVEEPRWDP